MPSGFYKETGLPYNNAFKKGHKVNVGRHFKVKDTSNYKYKKSDEAKKNMSLVRIGIKRSKEICNKISNSKKGIPPSCIFKNGKIIKGELHPLYIKDRTQLVKNEKKHLDYAYRCWMLKVKKRDDWKCRIANENCKGRLEAHHILSWKNYPELRYELNNGITLCLAHHPRSRKKEAELSPYFQKLVNEMKNFD